MRCHAQRGNGGDAEFAACLDPDAFALVLQTLGSSQKAAASDSHFRPQVTIRVNRVMIRVNRTTIRVNKVLIRVDKVTIRVNKATIRVDKATIRERTSVRRRAETETFDPLRNTFSLFSHEPFDGLELHHSRSSGFRV